MKKILINTLGKGNMSALNDYAAQYFPNKYKIIFKDYATINGRYSKIYNRVLDYTHHYDLVLSDYTTRLFSRGNQSILINHGYGTKVSPGLEELDNKKIMAVNDSMRKHLSYIITMSERDEKYYLKYDSKVTDRYPVYLPLGVPRTDVLFNSDKHQEIKQTYLKQNHITEPKIVLYAPTWRQYDLSDKEKKELVANLKQLASILLSMNYALVYRPHFIKPLLNEEELKNIINLYYIDSVVEKNSQVALIASDVLITDYSSIYIDYLALNRPIFFFDFDREKYENNRGLAINLDNDIETPGEKIKEISALSKIANGIVTDKYIVKRKEGLGLFYDYTDGKNTERIWKFIGEILEQGGN